MPYTTERTSTSLRSDNSEKRLPATGWPSDEERFNDRTEAGQILASTLAETITSKGPERPLVLGLPKGGILIGREIARAIDADLDVIVTHKVGLPWQPAFGVGAIANDGPPLFDRNALACAGTGTTSIAPAVQKERREIHRRRQQYRGERPPSNVTDRTVVITDDGLTPILNVRAAIRALRVEHPASIVYAAPVCAAESVDWLREEADDVRYLRSPRVFHALGLWYRNLSPITDDDAATILAETWGEAPRQES